MPVKACPAGLIERFHKADKDMYKAQIARMLVQHKLAEAERDTYKALVRVREVEIAELSR